MEKNSRRSIGIRFLLKLPFWVKEAVWRRDEGRCAFAEPGGGRCAKRAKLEYDRVLAWARGGRTDDPENTRLLCRAHNRLFSGRLTGGV